MLPAYAGMIPASSCEVLSPTRAPRVCGDDPFKPGEVGIYNVCSPRMRG